MSAPPPFPAHSPSSLLLQLQCSADALLPALHMPLGYSQNLLCYGLVRHCMLLPEEAPYISFFCQPDMCAKMPCRENERLIQELSIPAPGSQPLHFETRYPQPPLSQFRLIFWK